MKKTIFTFCSVIAVSAIIFMACTKEDNGNKQVDYASKTTVGTGGNPNPNNNPSSSGVTPTNTTTPPPTYGSFSDGTSHSFTASTACGSATMTGTYSGGTIQLIFSAPPTAGTYSLVPSSPAAGQVQMNCFGGTGNCTGTITVSGTSPVTAAFTSVYYNTTNITGSLKCM